MNPDEFVIEMDRAARSPVRGCGRLDRDDFLTHQDPTLDHPVERPVIGQQFIVTPRRVAGENTQNRPVSGGLAISDTLFLALTQMVDGLDADGELYEMNGHGHTIAAACAQVNGVGRRACG